MLGILCQSFSKVLTYMLVDVFLNGSYKDDIGMPHARPRLEGLNSQALINKPPRYHRNYESIFANDPFKGNFTSFYCTQPGIVNLLY